MINSELLFFLQASLLITLSLFVSGTVFFLCIRYGGNWAGLNAPDAPLSKLCK